MPHVYDIEIYSYYYLDVYFAYGGFCCLVSKSCPTLWPHGLQHSRLPCPSLSSRVCSDSCSLSQWCHQTIQPTCFSVTCFSSCPQSFPASGSFPMSQLFTSCGQSIRASASVSSFQFRINFLQDWLIWSPCSKRLQDHNSKALILWCSAFFMVQFSHPYMTTGKALSLTRWIFVSKVMSLLFNMLSRLVITSFQGVSVF